jgi:UDPglucose 6-dehydrogenase
MRLTIVGSGYVGLTTGICLAGLGHEVRCVDVVPEDVAAINAGKPPFYEPQLAERLGEVLANGRLRATTDLDAAVTGSSMTVIAVGTPTTDRGIDLSYVMAAVRQVGLALRGVDNYHVVVVKSTVVPGTTDGLVRRLLEETSGRVVGEFGLCVNPEFLREGSAIHDFLHADRIVIGQWDNRSGQELAEVYRSFDCPILVTTMRNAEMMKYASNAFLATLISFSNEIAALCEATPGTDVTEVLRGLHLDRRLSPVVDGKRIRPGILDFLWAGCGFGGSCLPKDVNALRAYARECSVATDVLDAVMAVNCRRPAQLVGLAERALGSLSGANATVLGLAFKPNTGDVRASPALPVIKLLRSKGANVRAYDPLVYSAYALDGVRESVTLCPTPDIALRDADVALLVTACPEFAGWDWTTLCGSMRQPVVVDGRHALSRVSWPSDARYLTIGQAPLGVGSN